MVWQRRQTNVTQGRSESVVPVTWAAPKAIEQFIQEPILICIINGVSNWGAHCNPLVIREDSLTKGVPAVSLLENVLVGTRLRGEEAKRGVLENRRVLVCF
jgi:hypothetical protein